jgi:hypothetical protein
VAALGHSMALKADGSLWTWGGNDNGQLGDGTTTERHTPVKIGSDAWLAIAPGSRHSAALRSDHSLWEWGSNTRGQLGIGALSFRTSPAQVFFEGESPLLPLFPETGTVFQACSMIKSALPQFQWEAIEPFSKYTLLFMAPTTGMETPFLKATVQSSKKSWPPSTNSWKKILLASHNGGSAQVIYWKIVGEKPDQTGVTSEVRNFRVGIPQAVTIQTPPNASILPTSIPPAFDFNTNYNGKFKLEVSSLSDFGSSSMVKSFNFTSKDPNVETIFHKSLSASQWSSVKKLVGTGTGYFRIRAWDALNRETVSEVRSFTVE